MAGIGEGDALAIIVAGEDLLQADRRIEHVGEGMVGEIVVAIGIHPLQARKILPSNRDVDPDRGKGALEIFTCPLEILAERLEVVGKRKAELAIQADSRPRRAASRPSWDRTHRS